MFNRSGPGRQCFFMFALFSQNLIHDAAVGGGGRRAGGERVGGGGREASGLGSGGRAPQDHLQVAGPSRADVLVLSGPYPSRSLENCTLCDVCAMFHIFFDIRYIFGIYI